MAKNPLINSLVGTMDIRRGCVGLDDIKWVRGVIHVHKAKTQKARNIKIPKTISSLREVKMLEPAYQVLPAQKQALF